MVKLTKLKKIKTYEDLEDLGIGRIYCDISYRGGGIGFYSSDIARVFEVSEAHLPYKFGAGCNYLGGGLRGCIFASDFSSEIKGRKADLLSALAEACIRVYEWIEKEDRIPDDIMEGIARVNKISAY